MLSTSLKLFLESERCAICDRILSAAHSGRSECFYTRTQTFTHKRFYTQTLLHTDAFTLYTDTFTHRHFTQRGFYTQKLAHTQRLLHTEAFTHTEFYSQKLLHADPFTHRDFYT